MQKVFFLKSVCFSLYTFWFPSTIQSNFFPNGIFKYPFVLTYLDVDPGSTKKSIKTKNWDIKKIQAQPFFSFQNCTSKSCADSSTAYLQKSKIRLYNFNSEASKSQKVWQWNKGREIVHYLKNEILFTNQCVIPTVFD